MTTDVELLTAEHWREYGYTPKKDYKPEYRNAHGELLFAREHVERTLLPTMCESCNTFFDHRGDCYGCPPF